MESAKPISPEEFLDAMFDSDEDQHALKDFLKQRQIVAKLAAIRVANGVTQADIAAHLDCGQSAVSKLESGIDAVVTLAHLQAYAKATGSEMTILMSERGKTLADQIKHHALCIHQTFLKLVDLAHRDDDIAKGVAKLHMEAFQNINRMLAETAEKLPPCEENGRPYIQITSSEDVKDLDADTSANSPPPPKRTGKRPTSRPRRLQSS